MNETSIINYLKQGFETKIGDDAAVFSNFVISKDLLIEDIHFRIRYNDPASLAYKAIHANLSDIAAMGASPCYILLGLAIPESYCRHIEMFLNSFKRVCLEEGITLIGGDTTKSTDKLSISITVIGQTFKPVFRSTAKVGDIICVAGKLGHAHIGLIALENNVPGLDEFKQSLLTPHAKIAEGNWLAKHSCSSMMDISDGLLVDLEKLCVASDVSAIINLESLRASERFSKACKILGLDPISIKLAGGEDYSLLFTIDPQFYEEQNIKFIEQFSYPLKKIGRIVKKEIKSEVKLNQDFILKQKLFSHFREFL